MPGPVPSLALVPFCRLSTERHEAGGARARRCCSRVYQSSQRVGPRAHTSHRERTPCLGGPGTPVRASRPLSARAPAASFKHKGAKSQRHSKKLSTSDTTGYPHTHRHPYTGRTRQYDDTQKRQAYLAGWPQSWHRWRGQFHTARLSGTAYPKHSVAQTSRHGQQG